MPHKCLECGGEILVGHICGVFLRRDNDHKFVAADDEIRRNMKTADLLSLDKVFYEELIRIYPRVGEGEGWFGAEVAFSHLINSSVVFWSFCMIGSPLSGKNW